MPSPIHNTPLSISFMRAKGGADWISFDDFLIAKKCSRHTVARRLDIPTKKIDGHVFVSRSALDVSIRGSAK